MLRRKNRAHTQMPVLAPLSGTAAKRADYLAISKRSGVGCTAF